MPTKEDHLATAAYVAERKTFDYMHIVATRSGFTIKGYDEWPSHSVLTGQVRKNFVDFFELHELELAQEVYPEATLSNEWIEPQNSFNHLSDKPDY